MSHTISQVKSFPVGTVIPSVTGTLERVYPPKSGEGQYGPWKLQSFVLSDGEDKIKGTLFDGADISDLQGKQVTLVASGTNGKTKRKQGVEVVANKQDQTPELSVKHKQGGIVSGEANPAHLRGTPAANAPASAVSSPKAAFSSPVPTEDPLQALNRLASFWLACWVKSADIIGLTTEVRQSMTSCLFIEGNKQGLAKAWPIKPIAANTQMNPAPETSDNPF
jgi:hypothetical protein